MYWNKRLLGTPTDGAASPKQGLKRTSKESYDISDHFMQFLRPIIANNNQLNEEVFKIRHMVYCEELTYEDVREDGLETDEFDKQSLYTLVKHIPSSTFTSCVRLVASRSPEELLPIEKFCINSITNEALNPKRFKRCEIAEISRLAVKPDFRRRKADQFKGSSTGGVNETLYSETEMRCFPLIAISLYMSAAAMCLHTGIKHIYVMMEPRLARSMSDIGIAFQQIGPEINYHGLRAPYHVTPELSMSNLSPGFTKLFKIINNDLFEQLKALGLA